MREEMEQILAAGKHLSQAASSLSEAARLLPVQRMEGAKRRLEEWSRECKTIAEGMQALQSWMEIKRS